MKASILDLRRRMREVLRAIDRNQSVTVFYRGKKKAVIYPAKGGAKKPCRVISHPAFGMWKDRADLADVPKIVRNLRKSRNDAV